MSGGKNKTLVWQVVCSAQCVCTASVKIERHEVGIFQVPLVIACLSILAISILIILFSIKVNLITKSQIPNFTNIMMDHGKGD